MLKIPYHSKSVRTGAYITHYLESGSGEPLVLIHGGGPGADGYGNWNNCIPYFSDHFQVLAYDMVGFGRSDAPDSEGFEYSMDARAQQVIDFIEALGLSGRANVIGNSMGAAAALGAVMKNPELVRNLVLMGSAGLSKQLPPAAGKLMHYDFTLEGMQRVATALAYPGFGISDEMIRYRYELTMNEDIRRGTEATQGWVKKNGGLYYEEEELGRIKNRTLVVHGKDDPIVPLDKAYRFLELLENSHGYILPKCGHWAMLEYPKLFSEVCIGFIKSAPSN